MATPDPPPPPESPGHVAPKVFSAETVRVSYDHETSRWGLPDFVVCLAIFTAVGFGTLFILDFVSGDRSTLAGPWLLAALGVPPAVELLYLTGISRFKGRGLAADLRLDFEPGDIRLGLKLCGLAIFCAGVIVVVWSRFGELPTAAAADVAEASSSSLTIWIWAFALMGATFVPLVEELVFRGLFWSALEKRGHGQVFILLATSAGFSLFHLEPARSPILFIIGIAIGLGRLRTGRIGPSIAAHMGINSLAMIGLLSQFGEAT